MNKVFATLLMGLIIPSTWAGPACVKQGNPCDPNLLCTFKAEWQSKAHVYSIYRANSPDRKKKGKLFLESIAEARAMLPPDAEYAVVSSKADQIFQEKIRKKAQETFRPPKCALNGEIQINKLYKEGYNGMETRSNCSVWVNFEGGQYDPRSFGQKDEVCGEFYNRDYAHEQIHRKLCLEAKEDQTTVERDTLENSIREEMKSYKHSMKLTEAYYKILLSQCSPKFPNRINMRKQLKTISELLEGYESRLQQ